MNAGSVLPAVYQGNPQLGGRIAGWLVTLALCLLGVTATATPSPADTWSELPRASLSVAPLLQDGAPVERQLRRRVKEIYRDLRRSLKRSQYFVFNSPTWWWRRVQRSFWPVVFALSALFLDGALLAEWKNRGLRVLTTFVPLMLYVYGRLFFARGVSIVTRIGVVVALLYGVWRRDLIPDGRWSALGWGKFDDFVLIVLAVRAFVYSCPEALVERYAGYAIALRGRVLEARTGMQPR